jgi:hypothetical protein
MSVTVDRPADFPALFRSADRESLRAQRSYLRSLRVRLGALLVAAFGGALTLTTAAGFQIGGGLAFLAFACALGAELFLATTSPLATWYEGRAAAESAKTLAWRYMVRGEPFEVDEPDVDKQFLAQTHSLLQDLQSLSLGTGEPDAHQITDRMRQIRALDFEERRQIYLVDRIADQQRWYSEKARWNDRRARSWVLVSIVLEIAGLIGGALKGLDQLRPARFPCGSGRMCHGLDRSEATPQPGDRIWHCQPRAGFDCDRASDGEQRGALGCLGGSGRRGDLP